MVHDGEVPWIFWNRGGAIAAAGESLAEWSAVGGISASTYPSFSPQYLSLSSIDLISAQGQVY